MRHDDRGNVDGQPAVTELVQVKQVGPDFLDHRPQVLAGSINVARRFLHPFQAEGGRAKIEAVKTVHPVRLSWGRDFSKADKSDTHATADEAGHQLPRVGPYP